MPVPEEKSPHRAGRDELKICGVAAVRARFQRDTPSIHRLYFDYATGRKIGLMCKALAAARKIYRCVEPAELERIAGTIHHGGIVAVTDAPAPAAVAPADLARWVRRREPLLVLDRVSNAHNLGAIARTAAFFGVPRIVIPDDPAAARPNDAAYRVAEGGLENLEVRLAPAGPAFLRDLAGAGYEVVGAATRGGTGAASPLRPDPAIPGRPPGQRGAWARSRTGRRVHAAGHDPGGWPRRVTQRLRRRRRPHLAAARPRREITVAHPARFCLPSPLSPPAFPP